MAGGVKLVRDAVTLTVPASSVEEMKKLGWREPTAAPKPTTKTAKPAATK